MKSPIMQISNKICFWNHRHIQKHTKTTREHQLHARKQKYARFRWLRWTLKSYNQSWRKLFSENRTWLKPRKFSKMSNLPCAVNIYVRRTARCLAYCRWRRYTPADTERYSHCSRRRAMRPPPAFPYPRFRKVDTSK